MNLVFLRTFLELSQTKSFIQTARNLHMTQPGVSQHLKHLENYYGTELVKRKGKQFQLTEAGRKLRQYSENLFREEETFRNKIVEDSPTEGICYIAGPGSIGIVLQEQIFMLYKKYPKLIFHQTVAPDESVVKGVESEQYHMGFVSSDPQSWKIKKTKLGQQKLLLVAPKKAKVESLEDLNKIGFIAHPDGYNYGNHILSENFPDSFKSIEEIRFSGFTNQNNRILYAVEEGLGFAVVPEYTYCSHPNKKKLQIVPLKHQIMRPINLITKKDNILPKRYYTFLQEFRKYMQELSEESAIG
ncbi:MAG: LysR family transcriptional regulator [Bdellovibrio sp.]